MDPVVAFAAGVGVSVVVGSVGLRMALRRSAAKSEQSSQISATMLALYETQPDGVYAWVDGAEQSEQCSVALEDLLQLPHGAVTAFERVAEAFAASESVLLNNAARALRETGEIFDLLMPLGERMMHVIGRRAQGSGDIIWFRDVSALALPADASHAEDQMRAVFDAMPIPVWLRDSDLELAFTNERASAAGNAVARRATEIASRAAQDGSVQTERRMLDVDGSRRVLEITEASLGAGGGTVGFAVEHLGADTDELKAAVAHQRSVFDHMLGNLSAGIVVYGADKRIETHNTAFAVLWHMDEAWLDDGPSLSQVLDHMRESRLAQEEPDFNAYRAAENGLFDTLDAAQERTLYLPDGRTLRATVAPAGGGGLIYIYEDISDNLDLQRSYKTLNLVQRHTIDNLQEAVAVFGSDARLKLHNAPFAELWGLKDDMGEEEGSTEPLLSEVVEHMREPDMDDATWEDQRQGILANLSQRREHRARFRHTTATGDNKVYDVACVPLPDGAVLISYLDITDEAMVEDALRQRAEMLEETNQLKSKFIDDVSYEVRTPLTTITGFSEILTAEYFGELNARQREYLQGIQATADTLMTVVADILELAAIEGGTVKLEKDAVDLHAMLAQSMKLITERARHKEIHLTFDVPTDIGWISADAKRLRQVIFNLLANAMRFTPRRGGVRLSAERDDNDVILSVFDTGVGIPQADIDRVFQKFTKGEQSVPGSTGGEPEGAGLGLAMVKSFVELHGGTVTIKSPPNRGTTVTCRLPATGTEGGDARDAFES